MVTSDETCNLSGENYKKIPKLKLSHKSAAVEFQMKKAPSSPHISKHPRSRFQHKITHMYTQMITKSQETDEINKLIWL